MVEISGVQLNFINVCEYPTMMTIAIASESAYKRPIIFDSTTSNLSVLLLKAISLTHLDTFSLAFSIFQDSLFQNAIFQDSIFQDSLFQNANAHTDITAFQYFRIRYFKMRYFTIRYFRMQGYYSICY